MRDLDDELRQGLAAGAPPWRDARELVSVFRRRVAARRRRRVAGAVMAFAVVAGAAAVATRPTPEQARPLASSTTTTIRTVAPAAVASLPAEGVAVETDTGVRLLALDGRVLAELPGYMLRSTTPGGPQVLSDGPDSYVIADGGLRPVDPDVEEVLSYGAEVVATTDADPGRFVVRRGRRTLFEVSNNMDGLRAVSYDRDIVTNMWADRSEAHDLRTGRTSRLPADCWVADRHGRRQYRVCGGNVWVGGDMLVAGPDPGGHWESVMASPDDRWLLLQWSNECEAPAALVVTEAGGVQPLRLFAAGASEAHGWTADGRAVVSVSPSPGCRPAGGVETGVWLVAPDGTRARIHPDPGRRMALWSPALG